MPKKPVNKKKVDSENVNEKPDKYVKDFSLRVSVLRNKKGVSARRMSSDLEKNDGYINGIENGQSSPRFLEFISICNYLGVSPSEFFAYFTEEDVPDKRTELHSMIALLTEAQVDAIHTIISDLIR